MTSLRNTILSLAIATLTLGTYAQTDAEHAQHHPAYAAKSSTKEPSKAKESMAAMDSQMKTMRAMHEKMMAAKTPEERKALMGEHMKAIQDGMAMMGKMGPGGRMPGMGDKKGSMSMDMMEKRMEMMTSMMQMMMDRMPSAAAQ